MICRKRVLNTIVFTPKSPPTGGDFKSVFLFKPPLGGLGVSPPEVILGRLRKMDLLNYPLNIRKKRYNKQHY